MSADDEPAGSRATWKRAALALLLAAILSLCAAAWLTEEQRAERRSARAAFPTTAGAIALPDLGQSVQIVRDERGVPHIEAANEMDAWSALGFSHAQDRLAQMFWLRRLARGRTAEVVGDRGLEADRLVRTLGFGAHADAEALRLDPATRETLDAYASGVNARMERIRAGSVAPPIALGAAADLAEPWVAGDSLAVVKLLAWNAGPAVETAAVLWDLVDRLGSVAARPFMPTGLGVRGADMTIELPEPAPRVAEIAAGKGRGPAGSGSGPAAPVPSGAGVLADALLRSTAWVVSGRLTRSGAPILSVDFHLPPTVPSLIYQVELRAGELDVAGVTVPGVPVFWAGRNRQLAWAATLARVVTADLYRETLDPEDANKYRHGRTWLELQERSEIIEVAQPGAPARRETLRILETRHGPIVNELIGREGDPLALAWTGAQPGNGVVGMLGVARATNESELRFALGQHHEPAIALLYAETTGAAGLQVAGWIPRRRLPSGLVPMPGRQTVFDWRGPIEPADLPHRQLEAGADWLVASDGPLIDGLGGKIEWLWRTGVMAARLESRLKAICQTGSPLEQRDLAALRPERWSLRSPAAVAALLRLAGDPDSLAPEEREVADMLASWDGTIWSGSRGAAAEHLVFHHLTRELFADALGPERLRSYLELPHVSPSAVTEGVVMAAASSQGGPGWREPERVGRAIRASLRAAWLSLSQRVGMGRDQWQWGRVTDLAFRRFRRFQRTGREGGGAELGELGGEAKLEEAHRQLRDLAASGPVAVLEPNEPFEVQAATTSRLVMDLGLPSQMLSRLAPGQSEHPYHPHFDDGSDTLLDGRSRQLAASHTGGDEATVPRLLLERAAPPP